jgi:hypothetical protein
MTYFETSCRTGENIADLFEQIASDLVRQHNPEIVKTFSLFILLIFPFFSILA